MLNVGFMQCEKLSSVLQYEFQLSSFESQVSIFYLMPPLLGQATLSVLARKPPAAS